MSADDNAVEQILTADLRDPVSWARDIIVMTRSRPIRQASKSRAPDECKFPFANYFSAFPGGLQLKLHNRKSFFWRKA